MKKIRISTDISCFKCSLKYNHNLKNKDIVDKDLMKLLCTPGNQYIVPVHLTKEELISLISTSS